MRIVKIANPPPVPVLIDRFGSRRHPFILDSSQSNDGLGQFSFFGADPFLTLRGKDGGYEATSGDTHHLLQGDGLAILREQMKPYRTDLPRQSTIPFCGGAVGFFAYDYGRQIEKIPKIATDDRAIPDLSFGFYDGIAALNHKTGTLSLVALGIRAEEEAVLDELQGIVETSLQTTTPKDSTRKGPWMWNMKREDFLAKVKSIRNFIASGDVYQVNLSQRARCPYIGNQLQLYQALRLGNPAPYSAYLDTGDLTVLSTSPEQLLRKRGAQLETRPMKGTRPRGKHPEATRRHMEALKGSEKDRAELFMVVDLERNDLGRVAEFGSVRVESLFQLETYASVIQQTAQVKAQLAAHCDTLDVVRALFPGGSITGTPKLRAMELIEALEPTRRGLYTGSIGYLGFDGNADLNVAIRSLHLKGGYLDYQVGSGIVWDSDPENEYQETLDKGRAIHETIEALCQPL